MHSVGSTWVVRLAACHRRRASTGTSAGTSPGAGTSLRSWPNGNSYCYCNLTNQDILASKAARPFLVENASIQVMSASVACRRFIAAQRAPNTRAGGLGCGQPPCLLHCMPVAVLPCVVAIQW